ncbi:MAG: hypothetical protein JO052_20830 [Bradyrhizobium sp.]|nr:hypothetical protein [Bradyrhizobium sp.]
MLAVHVDASARAMVSRPAGAFSRVPMTAIKCKRRLLRTCIRSFLPRFTIAQISSRQMTWMLGSRHQHYTILRHCTQHDNSASSEKYGEFVEPNHASFVHQR